MIKRLVALILVLLLSIENFAAVVSDNDGSAFITKAEFDSLKNDFQSQINQYNTSIDNKIDGAIASYLSGITIEKESRINTIWDNMSSSVLDPNYKMLVIIGNENNSWFWQNAQGWTGTYGRMPTFSYDIDLHIANYMPDHRSDAIAANHIRLQSNNSNVVNASFDGDSVSGDIKRVLYGLRCTSFHHGFREINTSGDRWWDYPCFVSAGPGTDPGWELGFKELNYNFEAGYWSSSGAGNTFRGNVFRSRFMLRDAAPSTTYPEATGITEPLYHFRQTSLGATTSDWSYVANNGSQYSGLFEQESGEFIIGKNNPSWGDSVYYFWPNVTDQTLFVFNSTNIAQNFKTETIPDGTMWGDWDVLGLNVHNQRVKLIQNPMAMKVAEDQGYTVFSWNNVKITGKVSLWNPDQVKNISSLNWINLKDQGKPMLLGDAPRIITNLEKSGELTLTGGCKVSYIQSTYNPVNGCRLYFSPNGRRDVVNTGTETNPIYNINNKMKFRYRLLGDNLWSNEVSELQISKTDMENNLYEFKFDMVDAKQDIYIHVLPRDDADYKNMWFRVDVVNDIEAKLLAN